MIGLDVWVQSPIQPGLLAEAQQVFVGIVTGLVHEYLQPQLQHGRLPLVPVISAFPK